MKKSVILLFFLLFLNEASASIKENIIQNLKNTDNLSFNFEQNINGKVEIGNCIVKYPKKIFCKYDTENKKTLISNGESLVIKTSTSFYIYPIKKTPLNLILDKNFLLKKVRDSDERLIDNKFINFSFSQDENKINVFFDKNTYNLIGWQTLDIYQNLSITYIFSILKNQKLDKNQFSLPNRN